MKFIISNINNSYENIANSFLIYLYNYVKENYSIEDNSLLNGKIEVNNGYYSMIDYLTGLFNNLNINVIRAPYLEFEDNICKDFFANEFGDGLGVTENDIKDLTYQTLSNKLLSEGIVKFNELRYLTKITSLYQLNNFFALCRGTLEEINLMNITSITDFVFGPESEPYGVLKTLGDISNVTSIGKCAFRNQQNLAHINFPNLTHLGYGAFQRMPSLIDAHVDGTIDKIDSYMFYGDSNLELVSGFSNISSIASEAFSNCSKLSTINIPWENITSLGSNVFQGNYVFDFPTGIVLNKLTNVSSTFKKCNINFNPKIIAPNLRTAAESLFCENTGIVNVDLSNFTGGLNNQYMFYKCTNLENVILPDYENLRLGNFYFQECPKLKTVNLTSNCVSIGNTCFYKCNALTSVGDVSGLTSVGNQAFAYNSSGLSLDFDSLPILQNGQEFRGSVFGNLTFNSLTNINSSEAFRDSTINSISFPELLTTTFQVFQSANIQSISMPKIKSLGARAFYNCKGITNVNISTIETMEEQAFEGATDLISINFGNLIETLPASVCRYDNKLVTVLGLENCKTIGDIAFNQCSVLTTINLSNVRKIQSQAFQNCTSLISIDLHSVTTFEGTNNIANCTELESIGQLNNNLQTIPASCFYNCKKLKDITIPASVTEIGSEAFRYDTSLIMTFNGLTPPTLTGTNNFNGVIKLKVPGAALSEYLTQYSSYNSIITPYYDVLDILYENSNGELKVSKDVLSADKGYTPIALCIAETEFFGDNEPARWISLKYMSNTAPETGSLTKKEICYGNFRTDISTINNIQLTHNGGYYEGNFNLDWYDNSTDSHKIPNMINSNGKWNLSVLGTVNSYATTDIDGKNKTTKMLATVTSQSNWETSSSITNNNGSGYAPAACCCARYHTLGTQAGDWYLPAIGELSMLLIHLTNINAKLAAIHNIYSSKCIGSIEEYIAIWSSTEHNNETAYKIDTGWASIALFDKNDNTSVIAMLQY